jgi:2-oxoisovalerate dehydrogenase E1 component alpha subunit
LIEAVVHRLTSHSSDDDQRRYRDPAEVEALKQHDPIPLFASRLMSVGLLTTELDEQYRAEVKAAINEASKRAEARPDPDVATAERWVYAEDGV